MNINELPPELLIHILSFVQQWELVSCIQHVCNYFKELSTSPTLWTKCAYYNIDIDHLYQVQHYVKDLSISCKRLAMVFQHNSKIVLSSVKNLRILEPVDNKMLDILVSEKFVELFSNVESLSLCRLNYEFKMNICLNNLKKLNLNSLSIGNKATSSDTSCDDALLSFIDTQTNLQHLRLQGKVRVSDATIAKIINDYPQITMLQLLTGGHISNEVFTSYTSPMSLTNFTVVSDNLDDRGLQSLLRRSSFFTTLDIQYCRNITNHGLQNFNSYGDLLQDLSISFNDKDYDCCTCNQTLQVISSGCRKLRYFTALDCSHIDYSGVSELAKGCIDLTTIILKQCGQITDEMLLSFKNCKMLKKLCLYGIIDMSLNSVFTLLKSSKRLFRCSLEYHPTQMRTRTFTTDIRIADVDSRSSHSHVNVLDVHCIRDVTKENILKLAELCSDLRHLEFHGESVAQFKELRSHDGFLTEIDDAFVSELFHKCVFLSRFYLHHETFKRSSFV